MDIKPYRFMLTLAPETARILAQLRADSTDARGRTKSYAEIIRALIHEAAGRKL